MAYNKNKEQELAPYWKDFIAQKRYQKYISEQILVELDIDLLNLSRAEAIKCLRLHIDESRLKDLLNSFKVFKNRLSKGIKPIEINQQSKLKLDNIKQRCGFSSYDEALDYLFNPEPWLLEYLQELNHLDSALSLEQRFSVLCQRLQPQHLSTLNNVVDEMFLSGLKQKQVQAKQSAQACLENHPIKRIIKGL